ERAERKSEEGKDARTPLQVRTRGLGRALEKQLSVRQPDPRREAGVYVKPELTRTHVCQYLSRVCSGRGFGRPPPVGRAGAPAASVEPCPSGRSGLYQSWFDIERPASWQEMTEIRHRPC